MPFSLTFVLFFRVYFNLPQKKFKPASIANLKCMRKIRSQSLKEKVRAAEALNCYKDEGARCFDEKTTNFVHFKK